VEKSEAAVAQRGHCSVHEAQVAAFVRIHPAADPVPRSGVSGDMSIFIYFFDTLW
jgi:hypothetical protein